MKVLNKVLLFIICSLFQEFAFSQQGSISKIYFPNDVGFFNDIEKVPGGYLVTGASIDSHQNIFDTARIAKIDDEGQIIWSKKFSGGFTSEDSYPRLCRLNDGKIAWAEYGHFGNPGSAATLNVIIFDSLGNDIVSKKIQIHGNRYLGIAATADGGFIVTGPTFYYATGVYKFDNMLNLLWKEEIANTVGIDVDIDSLGRIFITNHTVTVLDSVGNIVDSCRAFANIENLTVLPDGYFLTGSDTNSTPFMSKVDFNWNVVWYKRAMLPEILYTHENFAENGKLYM